MIGYVGNRKDFTERGGASTNRGTRKHRKSYDLSSLMFKLATYLKLQMLVAFRKKSSLYKNKDSIYMIPEKWNLNFTYCGLVTPYGDLDLNLKFTKLRTQQNLPETRDIFRIDKFYVLLGHRFNQKWQLPQGLQMKLWGVQNAIFLSSKFTTKIKKFSWNCSQVNATEHFWWLVNIGSGNGLVPSGSKPLPEPMLTQIYVAMWHH